MTEMKRNSLKALLILFSLSTNVFAAEDYPSEFESQPSRRLIVSQEADYASPERTIRALLRSAKKRQSINHFCVVGYAWPDNNESVWVHWKEAKRLILWDGSSDPERRADGLINSRRDLELGRDTVKTANEIKGSSYLVTDRWWKPVTDDCEVHGEKYTIEPGDFKQ
jgi:hypothetical protein